MPTLGFIGAGNMAEAIARGLLRTAAYKPAAMFATDPDVRRQRLFIDELGIACGGAGEWIKAAEADAVILAVKPFVMGEVLGQIKSAVQQNALVISIAAGLSTRFIEQALGKGRVVRVMPNTPMLVGKGMTALCPGAKATADDMRVVEYIFAAGGKAVPVTEDLMDTVTAVSGSGPAYVYYLAECLAAAGVAAGLPPAQAEQLARQTVIGAAALLEQSPDTAAELRRKVTTPKGTTQAALETLQAGNLQDLLTSAVLAAKRRSQELGK